MELAASEGYSVTWPTPSKLGNCVKNWRSYDPITDKVKSILTFNRFEHIKVCQSCYQYVKEYQALIEFSISSLESVTMIELDFKGIDYIFPKIGYYG